VSSLVETTQQPFYRSVNFGCIIRMSECFWRIFAGVNSVANLDDTEIKNS